MPSSRQRRPAPSSPVTKDEFAEIVSSSENVLGASARGASYLILLQLFTRLLTFTFNQLILRHTTPSTFGFATIQLELLSSTILFLSREGFRIALQRTPGEIQRTVNLAYIPLVTGVVGSLVGCYTFYRGADGEVKRIGGFGESILCYGIATVVELASEPCFALTQQLLLFRTRTMAEGLAVVARCAVTYLSMMYLLREKRLESRAAIPFGLGQLAYAIVLTGVYLIVISKRVSLKPRKITPHDKERKEHKTGEKESGYWFHGPTLWLAFSVTGQSLFKHLLTEGDKLVLTFLTTPYTQGIYAVVSNYGSLIARILFQPMEETLRTLLSRLLSPPSPQSLQQSSTLITTLIKLHLLLALCIQVLIPPIIPTLILPLLGSIIGRDRFPAEALYTILYAYTYYIPIMAINGVTESFISSVATTPDLARQSRAMVLFSVIFLGSSWGLLRGLEMGGEGLVWANCVNLGVRIIWSTRFITQWYKGRGQGVGWGRVSPGAGTLLAAGLVSVGIRVVGLKGGLDGFVKSLGVVGMGGLVLVGCMYIHLF